MSETKQDASAFTVVARSACGCTFSPDGFFLVRNFPSSTGPVTIVFRTRRSPYKGLSKPLPRGLWAEVTGPAPDLKSAIAAFGQSAQNLVPVLSVSANAPIEDLTPELAFESAEGLEEREYFQQFLVDERVLPYRRRPVPCDLTHAVLEALGKSTEQDRIHRAMAHYCHALQHWGLGSEIISLSYIFMGAETLTPVLLHRTLTAEGINRGELVSKWSISLPELDGEVRRRLVFGGDEDLYREVKRASDGFEHGFLPFSMIRETAVKRQELAARYLREAILKALDLNPKVLKSLLAPPLDKPFSLAFSKYVWGKLLGQGADLAAEEQHYPILRWVSRVVEKPSEEGEDPKVTFEESITPSLADGIAFKANRFEIWGSKPSDFDT